MKYIIRIVLLAVALFLAKMLYDSIQEPLIFGEQSTERYQAAQAKMIKIKDFSIETGFSIRMLRYLEEVGVLTPTRDDNNYRIFNATQIEDALWIKKLQNLGIQLKEIELLNGSDPTEHLKVLRNVLIREQEIAEIKSESIPVLKSMVDFLTDKKALAQLDLEHPETIDRMMDALQKLIFDYRNQPLPVIVERLINRTGLLHFVATHEEKICVQ